MSRFEIYKDSKGETRFRYRASNGEVVFTSEGYKAKASALKTIESIKKTAADAAIEEVEAGAAKKSAGTKAGKATNGKAAAKASAPAAKGVKTAAAKTTAKPKAAPAKAAPAKARASGKAKATERA